MVAADGVEGHVAVELKEAARRQDRHAREIGGGCPLNGRPLRRVNKEIEVGRRRICRPTGTENSPHHGRFAWIRYGGDRLDLHGQIRAAGRRSDGAGRPSSAEAVHSVTATTQTSSKRRAGEGRNWVLICFSIAIGKSS